MAIAVLFVICALSLGATAVVGLLGIGQLALAGADSLERDGLARGVLAPRWSLTDSAGAAHASPPAAPLQLIMFADHSLRSFPSVVAGLRALRESCGQEDLTIVIVTRGPGHAAERVLPELGLAGIPVLHGSPRLYARYNVRVMPFAVLVGRDGTVRASSLVNHDWQLVKLREVAAIPLETGELAGRRAW